MANPQKTSNTAAAPAKAAAPKVKDVYPSIDHLFTSE